jgi:cytidine deaminase
MSISAETLAQLRETARQASARAYCPYSRFHVGAAILTPSGKIYPGCNFENASYGLSICAERGAVGQMIVSGETAFNLIAIYTPTAKPTLPCGACRQVLFEFGPNAEVICVCDVPGELKFTIAELLPGAFALAFR